MKILIKPPLPPDCLTDRPGTNLSRSPTLCAPDVLISYSVITVVDPPNFWVFIVVFPIVFGAFISISSELDTLIIKNKKIKP